MEFEYLTAPEMAAASGYLLTEQLELLEAIDETRALIPGLKKAHQAVLELTGTPTGEGADAALTRQLTALDAQHDGLVRAVIYGLDSAIQVALSCEEPKTQEAGMLELVRDVLFPDSLSTTMKPYLVEAGAATRAVAQLTPATRAVLESVPAYLHKNLLELVLRWGEVGGRLGTLLQTRTQGQALAADLPTTTRVRTGWIQKFSTLEVVLRSLEDHEQQAATLLLTLSSAVEAARARAKSRKANAKSEQTPEEAAGGT